LTNEPGGGGKEIRRQLAVLKKFLEGFDFVKMKPDGEAVRGGRIVAEGGKKPPDVKTSTWVLSQRGIAYAIYVGVGAQAELRLELPAGSYRAEWLDTRSGKVERAEDFVHGGGERPLTSPKYQEDIALRITARR
jgi:hypothetical protein